VHGEISLKRNVQRLVAHPKYRKKAKPERSYALIVYGDWPFSGSYRRQGVHHEQTLYRSKMGGSIHWDKQAQCWKISETEDLERYVAWAPTTSGEVMEPPRVGWKVHDHVRGIVDAGSFSSVLEEAGVAPDAAEGIIEKIVVGPDDLVRQSSTDRNTTNQAEASPKAAGSDAPKQVFRQKGDWTLKQALKDLPDLDQDKCSENDIWEKAVKNKQRALLHEAGLPNQAQVVETGHPYTESMPTREVCIDGARSLTVYFASRCCTSSDRATFQILAGGLDSTVSGSGACVEVQAPDGTRLQGMVVKRTGVPGKYCWRVRLDGRLEKTDAAEKAGGNEDKHEGVAIDDSWPMTGNTVEALYMNGQWYRARVSSVSEKLDYYPACNAPPEYLLTWLDGETKDCKKLRDQIRKPLAATAPSCVEEIPRYGRVVQPGSDCFAIYHEDPKIVHVAYGEESDTENVGLTVGSEISCFALDRSCPLTPISIGNFAGAGPAQERGIEEGWFFDLPATFEEAGASSKRLFVKVLAGLGGMEPCDDSATDGQVSAHLSRLLDAGFNDIEQLFARLNDGFRALTGVKLHFTNSTNSSAKLKPLQDAIVSYGPGQSVGAEIKMFKTDKEVHIDEFLEDGPAREAGVRFDWVLNISKTLARNPNKAGQLGEDVLRNNPNSLLALDSVELVFTLPDANRVRHFTGWGAIAETWAMKELPCINASFTFSCQSVCADDEKRWGVWALVLPGGAKRLSVQDVDSLAQKWVDVASNASGKQDKIDVEHDDWDEARLRALCELHGWEFEWMTEDGERRRRMNERSIFWKDAGSLAYAKKAVEASKAAREKRKQRTVPEPKVEMVDTGTQYDPPPA